MVKDNQRVLKEFCGALNLKLDGNSFKRQLGLTNNLLSKYSVDDLLLVIGYIKEHPLKTQITSIGYLPYVIDELLPKAMYERDKEVINSKMLEIKDNTKIEKQNKIKKKSLFANEICF